MENYKPGYLGKVLPVDNPSKLTQFVTDKYDAFSKIYDTCKGQSENISDIKVVESGNSGDDSLSVKISADKETIDSIKETSQNDQSVTVNDDVITARGNE